MLIEGQEIKKGLIIKQPWIDLILSGEKTWEMRTGHPPKHRGPVALIQKGTGLIVGVANMVDVLPAMSIPELMQHQDKHRIDYPNMPEAAKWVTPWVVDGAKRIEPVAYGKKSGPVIWVNL